MRKVLHIRLFKLVPFVQEWHLKQARVCLDNLPLFCPLNAFHTAGVKDHRPYLRIATASRNTNEVIQIFGRHECNLNLVSYETLVQVPGRSVLRLALAFEKNNLLNKYCVALMRRTVFSKCTRADCVGLYVSISIYLFNAYHNHLILNLLFLLQISAELSTSRRTSSGGTPGRASPKPVAAAHLPLVLHLLQSPVLRSAVLSDQLIADLSVYLAASCGTGPASAPEFKVGKKIAIRCSSLFALGTLWQWCTSTMHGVHNDILDKACACHCLNAVGRGNLWRMRGMSCGTVPPSFHAAANAQFSEATTRTTVSQPSFSPPHPPPRCSRRWEAQPQGKGPAARAPRHPVSNY